MESDLTLTEKLLLLAVRPEKGGLMGFSSQALDYTLVGAVLLEMTLSKNITIRDKRVEVISDKSNSPLHVYVLERLTRSSRPRKLRHWFEPFSISNRKVRAELYNSLLQKHEIRLEDRRFLFFTWEKPYLGPANHAYKLVDRIKSLIIETPVNQEDIYLLALLDPAELLRRIYPERSMRRSARLKIKQYLEKNRMSEVVIPAIEMVRAVKAALAARRAANGAAST